MRDVPPESEAYRAAFASSLFNGAATGYDFWAQVLSYGQYVRWRRALVASLMVSPSALALDVATGTGSVGRELRRRYGCRVVGVDVSPGMLAKATRKNLDPEAGLDLVLGTATCLPFPDAVFDAATFTFLLRYVDDQVSTLKEIARVVKPGGTVASLEFAVPSSFVWRWPWHVHTRAVLPLVTLPLGRGWARVGAFLGRSIREFYQKHSIEDVEQMWRQAGFAGVRSERLSLGGAVITVGRRT